MGHFKFATLALLSMVVVLQFHSSNGASILFFYAMTGQSHISSLWPLMEALAEKGHNVTLAAGLQPNSASNTKNSSVNVIYIPEIFEIFNDKWDDGADLLEDRIAGVNVQKIEQAWPFVVDTCKILLNSSTTHALVHDSHFDLVIMDYLYSECGLLLSVYKYKTQFGFWAAFAPFHQVYDDFGIPLETNSIPEALNVNSLDLAGRLWSTLKVFHWTYIRRHDFYEPIAQYAKEVFALDHTPYFPDLFKQTSLVLWNMHHVTDYARSLPPLFVRVAGMQIKETRKPLPKDMLEFIERPGSNGFIYVSFGTVVRFSKAKPDLRNKFLYAMGNQTKLRFLWKWEGDNVPENAPKNIYFSKWFPQQDVLAHKNIKGYIAHGGVNGLTEAVYFGVPMIIFPVVGEQEFNAVSLRNKGLAKALEITDFTQQQLEVAIQDLVVNETLRQYVDDASRVIKDHPMKPVDTALWWVEYALRHPQKTYLASPGVYQSIVERRFLDVFAVIYGTIAISLAIILFLIYNIVWLPLWQLTKVKTIEKTKLQ